MQVRKSEDTTTQSTNKQKGLFSKLDHEHHRRPRASSLKSFKLGLIPKFSLCSLSCSDSLVGEGPGLLEVIMGEPVVEPLVEGSIFRFLERMFTRVKSFFTGGLRADEAEEGDEADDRL